MKNFLRLLSAGLLAVAGALLPAQAQNPNPPGTPLITVAITGVVGATSDGSGNYVTNAGTPLTIRGQTIGTDPTGTRFFVDGQSVLPEGAGSNPIFEWTPPMPGVFTLVLQTADAAGNTAVSTPVRLFVRGTQIVTPQSNQLVPAGSSVMFRAEAAGAGSAPDFAVRSVQFFVDGVATGAPDTTAPFSFLFTVPAGAADGTLYNITAQATDFRGSTLTASPARQIRALAPAIGQLPTARILLPSAGAILPTGTPTTVSVEASAPGGFIRRVDTFINGVPLVPRFVFPYQAPWTPMVSGTYRVDAIAYDDRGNAVAASPVTVTAADPRPTVTFIRPFTSQTLAAGLPLSISGTGAGAGGALLAVVEFFQNGNTIARLEPTLNADGTITPIPVPFSATWSTPVAGPFGDYQLRIRVTDSNGLVAETPILVVTLFDAPLPVAEISSPSDGSVAAVGTPLRVTVAAADPSGIDSVTLRVNGADFLTSTTAPYSFDFTPAASGSYTFTAVVRSLTTKVTTSAPVSISVPTLTVPVPTLVRPADNSLTGMVGVPVYLEASAVTANQGAVISGIDFIANGVVVGAGVRVGQTSTFRLAWTPGAQGTYSVAARALDSSGRSGSTGVRTVTISSPSGTIPTASIVVPGPSSTAVASSPINLVAAALGTSITSVEFFANGGRLGAGVLEAGGVNWRFSGPSWSSLALGPGTYSVVAQVRDAAGNAAVSLPVTITVVAGVSPAPIVVAAALPGTASVGQAVRLAAAASSPSGAGIASVQFLANGTVVGTAPSAPFTFTWQPAAAGSYDILAVATDANGSTGLAPVVPVTVTASSPPAVVLSRPSVGSAPSGTVGTGYFLEASAQAGGGGAGAAVSSVVFFANGAQVATGTAVAGTNLFRATWTPTIGQTGPVSIVAVATDLLGNSTASSAVVATIAATTGTLPVVTLTSPAAGSTLTTSSTLNLIAAAVGTGVSAVEFFANGGSIGTATAEPGGSNWRLSGPSFAGLGLPAGAYTLIAVARDAASNVANSAPVAVTVTNAVTPAPSVLLDAPPASVFVGQSVNLAATVFPAQGASTASVRFLANGNLIGTATTAPFAVTWLPTTAGAYSLVAVATDSFGSTGVSSVRSVSVAVAPAPTISLVRPAVGNAPSGNVGTAYALEATAQPGAGTFGVSIASVRFLANGVQVATGTAVPGTNTFRASWTPVAGQSGTVTITAVATDTLGNSASATSPSFTIAPLVGQAPVVSFTSPAEGATVTTSTTVALAVNAVDPDGTVASVEFFRDGRSLGFASQDAGTNGWRLNLGFEVLGAGAVSVTALARDNSGNTTLSSPRTFTVEVASIPPPTVSLATSTSFVFLGQGVTLTATASSRGGTITRVEFFADGVLIGTARAAPFSFVWTPSGVKNYSVTAVATDSFGGAATATPQALAVVPPIPTVRSYSGIYSGTGVAGQIGAFATETAVWVIGFSSTGPRTAFVQRNVPLSAAGAFTVAAAGGAPGLTGATSPSGISATLSQPTATLVGALRAAEGPTRNLAGFYSGTSGRDSALIVSADGTVVLFLGGATAEGGSGFLTSDGSFAVTTNAGHSATGTVLATGLVTGTSPGGAFEARRVAPVLASGRAANLSTRGQVGVGAEVMIAGFVITGSAPRPVLVRAVGPTLANFGVPGVLANPTFAIFHSSGFRVAFNDDWNLASNASAIRATAASVGAFALNEGSRDAAVLVTLLPGVYTAQVAGVGGTTGVALVEVYDADLRSTDSRLINISTRARVGTGEAALIPGLVVDGQVPRRFLVRAVGPGLTAFGVPGVLASPVIVVQQGSATVASNTRWNSAPNAAEIRSVSATIGAFALAEGSADSAALVTLAPGIYTIQVSGVAGAAGVALVEVYEAP